jgi:hypothetical protein
MKFDNETGRISEVGSCPQVAVDANGVPVPLGTIHRREAIKKSINREGSSASLDPRH